MPQLNELKGTAALTKPAFTKKEERLIGSPPIVCLTVFSNFLFLVNLINNLLKSSINKNGSIQTLQTKVKKNATKMIDLSDRNRTVLK